MVVLRKGDLSAEEVMKIKAEIKAATAGMSERNLFVFLTIYRTWSMNLFLLTL